MIILHPMLFLFSFISSSLYTPKTNVDSLNCNSDGGFHITKKLNSLLNEAQNVSQELKDQISMIVNEMESKNENEIVRLIDETQSELIEIVGGEINTLEGIMATQVEGINKVMSRSLSNLLNDALIEKLKTDAGASHQASNQSGTNAGETKNTKQNIANKSPSTSKSAAVIFPDLKNKSPRSKNPRQAYTRGLNLNQNGSSPVSQGTDKDVKLSESLNETIAKISSLEIKSVDMSIDKANSAIITGIVNTLNTLAVKIQNSIAKNASDALDKIVIEIRKHYGTNQGK